MKIFKSITLCMLIGIATVGLTISPARAALIELDLNAVGDKLITLDDISGLEWLDVNATLGLSYNQALATTFITSQGFRHANTTEIGTLYTNTGLTLATNSLANFDGVSELLSVLGCTGSCSGPDPFQQGWADHDPSGTFVTIPLIQLFSVSAVVSLNLTSFSPKSNSAPQFGNYLVRETSLATIPLPAALPLFLTGLAGLGLMRRRRQQAQRD